MAQNGSATLVCDGRAVAALERATTLRGRARGLLGRDGIEGALLLQPARSVHTFGMRFPIDVAYLDASGVVLASQTLVPHRLGRHVRGTRAVVEAAAGSFGRWGVGPGAELRVEHQEAAA